MKKGITLKVSGVLAVSAVLGSALCSTAYAGTTSHKDSMSMSNNKATHASISKYYAHNVMTLVEELQNQMNKLQSGSTATATTGSSVSIVRPGIKIGPWHPGNLLSALAADLGISESTLESDLQSGQTVAQIAQKQGVSTTTLISELESTEASQLQANVTQLESNADKFITNFVNGTQATGINPVPQSTPGGPMIPTGSVPQSTPGGPMIPAGSVPQSTPGGPMIPASTTKATDAAAYKQLARVAESLMHMLQIDKEDGKSSTVSTDISQTNSILSTLKAAFPTSTTSTRNSPTEFTAAQLSAVQAATKSLEAIVAASGYSTTNSTTM